MPKRRARGYFIDDIGRATPDGSVLSDGMGDKPRCRQRHPVTPDIVCCQVAHKETIGCQANGVTDGIKWSCFWWPVDVASMH